MTLAERRTRLHFRLKDEAASMTTREELNADFDRLSESVLRVKRERDALLAAAKNALDAMLIPGVQIATHHWNYLREELRQAISNCEKE